MFSNFSKCKMQILLFIIRYTYGYQRKTHELSASFIGNALGIKKSHVFKHLTELARMNVITIEKKTGIRSNIIGINEDCLSWRIPKLVDTKNGTHKGTENGTLPEKKGTENGIQLNINNNLNKKRNKNTLHIPDFFPLLLSTYPNKMNRDGMTADAFEEIEQAGKGTLLKAITNYKRYIEENKDWYHPMNAASFFNGRWKDFVEDDKAEDDKTEPIYTEDGVMLE